MAAPDNSRSGETQLQSYWDRVSGAYAADDPLAAVCYPGAPVWLNRFFAALQWRVLGRVLEGLDLSHARALDIGCGFGRWTRWLHERGASAIGVDPTEGMLEAARRASPDEIEYRTMSATSLDFPDDSFDVVTCITVIQHLNPGEQHRAIAEIGRVLRPGGTAVLLDLVDLGDRGAIVYPRSGEAWIRAYAAEGMTLELWRGQEFVPLIRGFRRAAELAGRLLGMGGGGGEAGPSLLERTRGRPMFRVAYAGLWALVQLSKAVEPLCQALLPASWARHGCFVFRKGDPLPAE